jgi:TfoX/Sxy family transcriptional regulator of competence genes
VAFAAAFEKKQHKEQDNKDLWKQPEQEKMQERNAYHWSTERREAKIERTETVSVG